jgi:hypothetical protein
VALLASVLWFVILQHVLLRNFGYGIECLAFAYGDASNTKKVAANNYEWMT